VLALLERVQTDLSLRWSDKYFVIDFLLPTFCPYGPFLSDEILQIPKSNGACPASAAIQTISDYPFLPFS
jgi:hypothetical protein